MAILLAFDFGGTKLAAAVADTAVLQQSSSFPVWRAHQRVYAPPNSSAQSDLETMVKLGHELLAGGKATAVGISFGGPAHYATGMVHLSHHVAGWEAIPLQALFETEFGVPARLDNDANAAALGEWQFGAGQGIDDLLYITVSTGVGGGWILGGRPYRGQQGLAGEIGHTVADPAGPLCLCGKRGCVERLASGPYMAADWAALQPLAALQPSAALHPDGGHVTGKRVAELAAEGEETAVHILERGAWALGVGIGNAANLMNPQRVILGGGVSKAGEHWWRIVRQTATQTALPQVQFDIVPAMLGDDAPLWGAVMLANSARHGVNDSGHS